MSNNNRPPRPHPLQVAAAREAHRQMAAETPPRAPFAETIVRFKRPMNFGGDEPVLVKVFRQCHASVQLQGQSGIVLIVDHDKTEHLFSWDDVDTMENVPSQIESVGQAQSVGLAQ